MSQLLTSISHLQTQCNSISVFVPCACVTQHLVLSDIYVMIMWPGGVMVTVLARDTTGAKFDSRPFHFQVTTLGKLFTHM